MKAAKKKIEGGTEAVIDAQQPTAEKAEPNSGDKKDSIATNAIQYDDKFYDLDDDWICDDENNGLNDDGIADFINESESQVMSNSQREPGAVIDEE